MLSFAKWAALILLAILALASPLSGPASTGIEDQETLVAGGDQCCTLGLDCCAIPPK